MGGANTFGGVSESCITRNRERLPEPLPKDRSVWARLTKRIRLFESLAVICSSFDLILSIYTRSEFTALTLGALWLWNHSSNHIAASKVQILFRKFDLLWCGWHWWLSCILAWNFISFIHNIQKLLYHNTVAVEKESTRKKNPALKYLLENYSSEATLS